MNERPVYCQAHHYASHLASGRRRAKPRATYRVRRVGVPGSEAYYCGTHANAYRTVGWAVEKLEPEP